MVKQRPVLALLCLGLFLLLQCPNGNTSVQAEEVPVPWQPPIGIPAPEFGIVETVENVYGTGHFTHFVDNTHAEATDDENPNGTLEQPRKTIPLQLSAGSVVVVQGGPYTFENPRAIWELAGTREQPVFIRGREKDSPPMIHGLRIKATGQFFVIENFEFFRKSTIELNGRHGVLRHCEIHDSQTNPAVLASGEEMVIYNCHIHHNLVGKDRDCHGIYATSGAKRIWVVDNHLHHNGGDSFQAGHRATISPQYLYIGRNRMHDDRENAIDIKIAKDVIISQNVMSGYYQSSTSGGEAIRINDEGPQKNIWILFNQISNSRWAINPRKCSSPPYIVGNLIYDCEEAAIKDGAQSIVHNTIFRCGNGIEGGDQAVNNILCFLDKGVDRNVRDSRNNLFWHVRNPGPLLQSQAADPLFVDAENGDFHLQKESPAIQAATQVEVYDLFQKTYGIDILFDFGGKRPATKQVNGKRQRRDLGALESTS
ncbi:Hypothetical protein PBC10988_33080 [Planctomycetales bacterium 10988]|nr:Hypothetical protein PBC10988_33080 [Planctomycetales bacterium 10988]